jgi:hypothetical protein
LVFGGGFISIIVGLVLLLLKAQNFMKTMSRVRMWDLGCVFCMAGTLDLDLDLS